MTSVLQTCNIHIYHSQYSEKWLSLTIGGCGKYKTWRCLATSRHDKPVPEIWQSRKSGNENRLRESLIKKGKNCMREGQIIMNEYLYTH